MPHTILYVEDEPAIIELIQDVLVHPDVHLLTAPNGTDGLSAIRKIKPDLVMLDVIMPDRDGWSIYEEIRADADLGATPIIMLTAVLHKYHIIQEFARSPIDAYITKPFDAGAVRIAVERMLGVPLWGMTSQRPVTAVCKARLSHAVYHKRRMRHREMPHARRPKRW
jgi:two-component system OmpR family response regulator